MRILVVGAGPAGIAAAVRAQECGADVSVLDDNLAAGGQIWRGGMSHFWLRRLRRSGVPVLTQTQVIGGDAVARRLLVQTRDKACEVEYDKLILCSGARELFLPFPGWTLPGVMGVGGLQAMVKAGMPIQGKRVVIAGTGPLLLAVAAHLKKAGATVAVVAEQSPRKAVLDFAQQLAQQPGKLVQAGKLRASLARVPYLFDCWAERASGDGRLGQVHLRSGARTWTEPCDFAGVAYGLCPNTELAALLGCGGDSESGVTVNTEQQTDVADIYAAGECTGIGGVDLAIVEGQIAGYASCGRLEESRYLKRVRRRALAFGDRLAAAFALRPEVMRLCGPGTIVCRCEDVTYDEVREMPSFRTAKLQRRCGMGPCQGRICGPATRRLFGWTDDSVRPPLFPARIESLIETKL